MAVGIILLLFVSSAFANGSKNASVTLDTQTLRYTIHDSIVDNAVAVGSFKDEIFLTGWSYLEVNTKETFPDTVQAYAAGLVEGYLTQELLKKHWYNMASDYCTGEEMFCEHLKEFLQKNLNYMNENIALHRTHDSYWHQLRSLAQSVFSLKVALTLEQLRGLEDGYKNQTHEPSTIIDVMGFLILNIMGDLIDLERVFKRKEPRLVGSGSCSALIKVLPENEDVYFSHATWTTYSSMLRILKKYNFQFRTSFRESPKIPGHTCTFSSYPGVLFSQDDFYLISSGLAVTETTIQNRNTSLWQYVSPEGTILEWQRNLIANRLAKNGKQWNILFSMKNSGTYNNQWMVIDYKLFQPREPLQNGLLWVSEQMPGYFTAEDKTDTLREKSYWASYNIPYFEDIFNMSGSQAAVDKYGDYFTHDKAPRALIFSRDEKNVADVPSMIKLMRYNDYTNDPLSRCNCTPPYSADCAIASRNDLNPANGSYPFPSLGHYLEGATDMKLTTSKLFERLQFISIGGPTHNPLPPFQWSKSDFVTAKHTGHPDLWNFKPVIHKWK